LFSYERDSGEFHCFSKLYGLFMEKAREILIALSFSTKVYLSFGEDEFRGLNIFSFVRLLMNVGEANDDQFDHLDHVLILPRFVHVSILVMCFKGFISKVISYNAQTGLGCFLGMRSFSFPESLNAIVIGCGMNIATTCFIIFCDMLRISRIDSSSLRNNPEGKDTEGLEGLYLEEDSP
ncbi:hypothetical protein Tco_1442382, partial [Tanacetum coccineum]